MNFLEQLPVVLVAALVGGIKFKAYTFYNCLFYSFSRVLYNIGYMKGPDKRLIGALLQDLSVLGFLVMAYMSAWEMAFA